METRLVKGATYLAVTKGELTTLAESFGPALDGLAERASAFDEYDDDAELLVYVDESEHAPLARALADSGLDDTDEVADRLLLGDHGPDLYHTTDRAEE